MPIYLFPKYLHKYMLTFIHGFKHIDVFIQSLVDTSLHYIQLLITLVRCTSSSHSSGFHSVTIDFRSFNGYKVKKVV